jgi:type I restriction enzyme S subunit
MPDFLKDVADVIMGQSPPGETCNTTGEGLPLLNGPTEFGSHHPLPVQFTTDPKRVSSKGDLLFCVRGSTTGRMNWSDQTYALGRGLAAIRPKNGKHFSSFIKGCVEVSLPTLLMGATGSTFPSLSREQIENIGVEIPSGEDLKWIENVLGTLDDKIELNRKTNETLEAMAKALFKSWFVDFDPVRAKGEGRPTGLPDEISDLFPDSFEDSELGEIPSGWQVQTVADVSSAIFDGPHATPAESDSGNVFLGIKNMTGTRISLDEIRLIHDDDWEAWTRRVAPQPNDIVFTYEAALGLFALIPPKLKCCLGRRMALIRPLPENGCPHFWFHQFIAAPFQKIINERCIHGATVNRTPLTEFPDYPVLTPPLTLRGHFEDVASGLWAKIHALSDQSRTLVPLRDTLLPKLISGELRIPDAERMLEEVGV